MTPRLIAPFASGLLFGLGLAVSGMINPAKVLNFLDVAGQWDPSLALVMGAALAVTGIGYRVIFTRAEPLFEPRFQVPANREIDTRLIAGAAIFGAGWGLAGFCPGPALSAASLGIAEVYVFLAAMLGAILAYRLVEPRLARARSAV